MSTQPQSDESAVMIGAEVRKRLRISRMTFSKMCRNGAFPNAYQLDSGGGPRGHWRVPIADVEAWEESRRKTAATHFAA